MVIEIPYEAAERKSYWGLCPKAIVALYLELPAIKVSS